MRTEEEVSEDNRYEEVKIMCIGAPMILGGKNFPDCLHVDKWPGLRMIYDNVKEYGIVTWNGETAKVFNPVYTIAGKAKLPDRQPTVISMPQGKIVAQVGGPTHHVFQGHGAGQTGQEDKK